MAEVGHLHGAGGQGHIVIDPAYFRPSDVNSLLGDASKAKRILGWAPKVGFDALVEMMCTADLARLSA